MNLVTSLTPAPENVSELAETFLPHFKDHRKSDFLVLRSVHFSTVEALKALDIQYEEYEAWVAYDPVFKEWSTQNLKYVQRNVSSKLLEAAFMRNVFLQLGIDSDLLRKRFFSPEEMSPYEREEAKEASKRYSAANIAAMVKALEVGTDESGEEKKTQVIKIEIPVNQGSVTEVSIREAQAKALLDQFTRPADKNVIDAATGEVLNG